MNNIKQLYGHSLALLTDLYQLTMAYGYWKNDKINQQAVFTLFFRNNPFNSGYTIAAGLATVLEYIQNLHFTESDLNYLATLTGNNGQPLFEKSFLVYLSKLDFNCDIYAVPEGTIVFPHEPLLRVHGSLLKCQILETALLNIINFQTLIATKSTRVCYATQGDPVLEFGLRRAQGIDGSLSASRAAYIGGCAATSNVLAGKLFDIPVKGTHSHSWVMSFANEDESFQAYAEAMPNNCIFLVDTFNTLNGVKKAIEKGKWLREKGHKLIGIRLDSGDFVSLSQQARKMLDRAGFKQASIVASNDLDEHIITELKTAGAKINVWGVGTKLITSYEQPALGGVYKLSAISEESGDKWQYRLKLSEESIKISNPGLLQVRRFSDNHGYFSSDMIYNETMSPIGTYKMVNIAATEEYSTLSADKPYQDLLIPILRNGQVVVDLPSLSQIRQRVQTQLSHCPAVIKNLKTVDVYPVSLEMSLYHLKQKLIKTVS
jgi:nicotinate phosphoribosyltransferase